MKMVLWFIAAVVTATTVGIVVLSSPALAFLIVFLCGFSWFLMFCYFDRDSVKYRAKEYVFIIKRSGSEYESSKYKAEVHAKTIYYDIFDSTFGSEVRCASVYGSTTSEAFENAQRNLKERIGAFDANKKNGPMIRVVARSDILGE